jgi:CheY-like chemotaxis protein
MELALPKIDGFQVLEFLRRRNDKLDIPVVLLTSLTEQRDVDRCVSFGCRAFFIKPHARPERVVDAVKASIGELFYANI